MKWTLGIRVLSLFFDSQADQPFNQAASGSGIEQMREKNTFYGVGPHVGLELGYHVADTGLTVLVRTDFTTDLGDVHQGFFTFSTTPGLSGVTRDSGRMDAPMITVQAGAGWQPPFWPTTRLFLGYQYEYWWRVGGELDTGARANLWEQGVVLQAALHF
jgi:hypothetical protein